MVGVGDHKGPPHVNPGGLAGPAVPQEQLIRFFSELYQTSQLIYVCAMQSVAPCIADCWNAPAPNVKVQLGCVWGTPALSHECMNELTFDHQPKRAAKQLSFLVAVGVPSGFMWSDRVF